MTVGARCLLTIELTEPPPPHNPPPPLAGFLGRHVPSFEDVDVAECATKLARREQVEQGVDLGGVLSVSLSAGHRGRRITHGN